MLIRSSTTTLLFLGLLASVLLGSGSSLAIQPEDNAQLKATDLGFDPPPSSGNPRRTTGSGSRDPGWCPQDKGSGASFAVVNFPESTTEAHPSFQVQVPSTAARAVEFSLFDARGNGVYQTLIPFNRPLELLRVQVPHTIAPLTLNQPYRWVVSLVCQPSDRLQDRTITGYVRRVNGRPVSGSAHKF
jgi:Domain of Unknown Function (DUF928)